MSMSANWDVEAGVAPAASSGLRPLQRPLAYPQPSTLLLLFVTVTLFCGIVPAAFVLWFCLGSLFVAACMRLSLATEQLAEQAPYALSFLTSTPRGASGAAAATMLLLPPGHTGLLHLAMLDRDWAATTGSSFLFGSAARARANLLTEHDLALLKTHVHDVNCRHCDLGGDEPAPLPSSSSASSSSSCCSAWPESAPAGAAKQPGCHGRPLLPPPRLPVSSPLRQHSSSGGSLAAAPDAPGSWGGDGAAAAPATASPAEAGGSLYGIEQLAAADGGGGSALGAAGGAAAGTQQAPLGPAASDRFPSSAAASSSGSLAGLAAGAAPAGAASGWPGGSELLPANRSSFARSLLQAWGSSVSLDGSDDRPVCSVCLGTFRPGQLLTSLPCGHAFHKDCILPWLLQQGRKAASCPNCKQEVFT